MILRRHFPAPPLDQFIQFFWYYEGWDGSHSMERVLPDGTFELVINLQERPRRLFDRSDPARSTLFRRGWISGAHSQYIVIDAVPGASMIGAHFKPGGAAAFLRCAAAELRDQVVEFDAIWGSAAVSLRERLLMQAGPARKFAALEQFLSAQIKPVRRDPILQARVRWAVNRFSRQPQVSAVRTLSEELGVSHKHFIDLFREQVGLTPKLFCRIQRFQGALAQISSGVGVDWADVACACGYYDQAHFNNDFQAFAGLRPTGYRGLSPEYANYVAVSDSR